MYQRIFYGDFSEVKDVFILNNGIMNISNGEIINTVCRNFIFNTNELYIIKTKILQSVNDELREWFRAFKTQNKSHRNYPEYFKPILCYLEGSNFLFVFCISKISEYKYNIQEHGLWMMVF